MSEATNSNARWMISFADLLSVILAFQVLLYSMSKIPEDKTKHNDLTGTSTADYSIKKAETPSEAKISRTDTGLSTDYLETVIKEKLALHPELAKIQIHATSSALELLIDATDLDGKTLKKMADLLKTIDNRIEIYSGSLDESYLVTKRLQAKGLEKNLNFFESRKLRSKIDIVIYP